MLSKVKNFDGRNLCLACDSISPNYVSSLKSAMPLLYVLFEKGACR